MKLFRIVIIIGKTTHYFDAKASGIEEAVMRVSAFCELVGASQMSVAAFIKEPLMAGGENEK
jgi:hypothetical protein